MARTGSLPARGYRRSVLDCGENATDVEFPNRPRPRRIERRFLFVNKSTTKGQRVNFFLVILAVRISRTVQEFLAISYDLRYTRARRAPGGRLTQVRLVRYDCRHGSQRATPQEAAAIPYRTSVRIPAELERDARAPPA
jgi:hypothetical protein